MTAKPGYTLNKVPANFFTVEGAKTVTNDINSGVVTVAFLAAELGENVFNISDGAIKIESGTETNTLKVTYNDNRIKDNIPRESQIVITGSYSGGAGDAVYISPGVTASVKLSNVNINVSSTSNRCAFNIDGASVKLELAGDNNLRSGASRAGLRVPINASVTIIGNGYLTVNGGSNSAGIEAIMGKAVAQSPLTEVLLQPQAVPAQASATDTATKVAVAPSLWTVMR